MRHVAADAAPACHASSSASACSATAPTCCSSPRRRTRRAGTDHRRGGVGDYADPLPQALALTAIVITFGVTAFLLALGYRSWQITGDDQVEDDVEDRLVARARSETPNSPTQPDAELGSEFHSPVERRDERARPAPGRAARSVAAALRSSADALGCCPAHHQRGRAEPPCSASASRCWSRADDDGFVVHRRRRLAGTVSASRSSSTGSPA